MYGNHNTYLDTCMVVPCTYADNQCRDRIQALGQSPSGSTFFLDPDPHLDYTLNIFKKYFFMLASSSRIINIFG